MNELIISIFSNLIKVNEYLTKTSNDSNFKIQNEFRIRSLKNALRTIKNLSTDIKDIKELDGISGIGKGIKDRINEIIKTKKLKELDELCKNIDCLNLNKINIKDELLNIVGVGEIFVNKLLNIYKITSVKEFIDLVQNKKIKVSSTIELGIKYYNKLKFNIPRQEITKTLDYLETEISKIDDSIIIQICGSYRRQKLTSNDIDLLVTIPTILEEDKNLEKDIIQKIVKKLHDNNFLLDDITPQATDKYMGFIKYAKFPVRRIDIRFIPFLSWYPAILYFTGSKDLNLMMRNKAKKLGYKLNEYGIFKGSKNILVESEEEIFNLLEIKYLEPQERNF
uniref:DNA-directed DNA polymerase n=1 Tax=viral metagenome TaxID=1070528 RepID=A0A6C0H0B3_9ZZZZ